MKYTHSTSPNLHGFTLLELSIVLAVIAMLVGGIFAGTSLVRAAELRSVVTDANNYAAAVANFRSQYRGLPGDITNAANYWTSASNGNGDSTITGSERFQFWYQLNQAAMVDKSFTGAQYIIRRGAEVFSAGCFRLIAHKRMAGNFDNDCIGAFASFDDVGMRGFWVGHLLLR
jgi:prepilin-type N-terminal cleavage/methylation domain-containing protein